MKWMEIAWAELGVEEIPGPRNNETILGYFRSVGRTDVTSEVTPWCAAFAGACLAKAGIADGLTQEERLMARSFLKVGTAIEVPRVGAIAIFSRAGDPFSGHVTFVTGWSDTHLKCLGGNQADAVNEKWFPRSSLLGLRWPPGDATPADLAAQGSRIVGAAGQQQKDGAKATGAQAVDLIAEGAGLKDWAAQAADMQSSWSTLEQFGVFVVGKGKWVAGALALYWLGRMAWNSSWIKHWRAEDTSTGKTT